MKIFKNLKRMRAAVAAQQINGDSELAGALNTAAVAALLGGMSSPAFKSYMAIFSDNTDQLERLTVIKKDDQGKVIEPPYLKQMRAYIVSNAICDSQTNAFLT